MKIAKSTLKQIIKEEVVKLLVEQDEYDDYYDDYDYEEEELTPAQKIIKLLSSTDPDNVNLGLGILDDLGDQQLIDTIASHFVFDPTSASITTQGFDLPQELGMILNYFAEKSDRVKNMLDQIESLDMTDIFITNVDFLRFCTNLNWLNLRYCSKLQNVDALQGLTNLTRLDLGWCGSLQNVDGLKGCTNLTSLNLIWCESLQNVDGLKECTNLTHLTLEGCESLENVDGLKECTNLWSLDLSRCELLPPELQERFESDSSGTAYEQFMEVLKG